MPTVYPILKPHDWAHRQIVAHRQLMEGAEGAPIVAFGSDTGEQYQFVPRDKVDDVEGLYAEALANLTALDYPWELGDSRGLRFAASSGKEFSAEKILDPAAMRRCHELLEADRVVAVAPRRTCLMATRYGLTDAEMDLFVRLAEYTYRDDSYGHAPISPAFFVLEDGHVKQILFAKDGALPDPSRPAGRTRPWWKLWG